MRQLSSQDAAFIYAERPSWHMHVGALGIIDPTQAPEPLEGDIFDRMRELMIERLPEMPQFRWRLVDTPLGLDRPYWVEARDLDPDHHIRRVTLPSPGTDQQLDAFVADVMSTQLDRRHPLWEMYLIDGLEGGRIATLTKVHHALIDGASGSGLLLIMLDLTPEPRPPTTAVRDDVGTDVPTVSRRLLRGVRSAMIDTPSRFVAFTAQSVWQGATAAARMLPGFAARQMPTLPFQAPRTVLNGEFTPQRHLTRAQFDLDRFLALKEEHGVKVNDVVLTVVGGALRTYLGEVDELPKQPLVAQCPVSLRPPGNHDGVGNKVGSIFVNLATHVADPVERLRCVRASTSAAKELRHVVAEHQHVGITEAVVPAAIGLGAWLYSGLHLERTPPPVNLVISNVTGPAMRLYVAGAPLMAMYPMGPLLLGMGLNVTAFSHDGVVDVGLFTCPDLVPEPDLLAEHLERALHDLEVASLFPV